MFLTQLCLDPADLTMLRGSVRAKSTVLSQANPWHGSRCSACLLPCLPTSPSLGLTSVTDRTATFLFCSVLVFILLVLGKNIVLVSLEIAIWSHTFNAQK